MALRLGVWTVCLAAVAASLLPVVPTDNWWIRALDFPRLQVAMLLAVAMPGAGWLLGWWRGATRVLVAAMAGALALQLAWLWPYTPLHPVQVKLAGACRAGQRLSLVVANLQEDNSGAGRFLAEVRRVDPDVVFVVEIDGRWADALAPLEGRYPHRVVHPRDDYWGLAVYSRLALVEPEVRHLLSDYVPSLRAGLRLESGAVAWFHGLHPKPPLPGTGTGQRDAELLLAALAVREAGLPAVMAGDLNAVAWSDTTALVQRVGGVIDPRIGRGPYVTFPTWMPSVLRVPIDHVLFTPAFDLLGLERLADIGSDHLPLLARLCMMQAAGVPTVSAPAAREGDMARARAVIREGREVAARQPVGD